MWETFFSFLYIYFFFSLMFSLIEYVSSLGWLHNNWITFRHLSALHLIQFMQLSSSHYNGRFNNSTVARLCQLLRPPTHNGWSDKLSSLAGCSSRSQVSAHEPCWFSYRSQVLCFNTFAAAIKRPSLYHSFKNKISTQKTKAKTIRKTIIISSEQRHIWSGWQGQLVFALLTGRIRNFVCC